MLKLIIIVIVVLVVWSLSKDGKGKRNWLKILGTLLVGWVAYGSVSKRSQKS